MGSARIRQPGKPCRQELVKAPNHPSQSLSSRKPAGGHTRLSKPEQKLRIPSQTASNLSFWCFPCRRYTSEEALDSAHFASQGSKMALRIILVEAPGRTRPRTAKS